jgi:D-alanyl-D-alanine carboxypeptidase (penicillin-binding protein 5/6)
VLLEKSRLPAVTTKVTVQPQVKAPVEKGQRLGSVTLLADGQVLTEIPLVAPEAVEAKTWWDLTKELLQKTCFCA